MIQGDGAEYELLEKWSKGFDCQGHRSCEIGVREGLGSKIIMDNVINNYMHVGIDPYGNLAYQHYDKSYTKYWPQHRRGNITANYTDEMRDTMLKDFYKYRNEGKFRLANMTDSLFMSHPEHQDMIFSFVHFDGPHMTKDVITEAVWFANRSAPHTRFIFDDQNRFEMHVVAHALTFFNFKTIEMGDTKVCLEKKL